MDDMHFEIEEFSVDGMLTRSMEMELETEELGLRDMIVKE